MRVARELAVESADRQCWPVGDILGRFGLQAGEATWRRQDTSAEGGGASWGRQWPDDAVKARGLQEVGGV